jgi:hypothetical protein
VISSEKELSKTAGNFGVHQVLEIRPSIMWDKGKALEFLLESLGTYFPLARARCLVSVRVSSTVAFACSFCIQYLRITPPAACPKTNGI